MKDILNRLQENLFDKKLVGISMGNLVSCEITNYYMKLFDSNKFSIKGKNQMVSLHGYYLCDVAS